MLLLMSMKGADEDEELKSGWHIGRLYILRQDDCQLMHVLAAALAEIAGDAMARMTTSSNKVTTQFRRIIDENESSLLRATTARFTMLMLLLLEYWRCRRRLGWLTLFL